MATTADVYHQHHHHHPPSNEQGKSGGATVFTEKCDGTDSESLKEHSTWKPGFWSQFPWAGIAPLIGVLVCSAACVIVIYLSNGKAKSEWKTKAAPNVLLSIFTSISSFLVTMAVGQGIAIAWWRKALKGATVEDLHHSWSFSASIMAIFTKYKFFNIMAVTALCTKFAIIDSTLYQKATETRTALGPPSQHDTSVFPLEQFPVTGELNEFGNSTSLMNFAMTYDAMNWQLSPQSINANILNGFYDCDGLCNLTYRGIGFESTCTMSNISASRSEATVNSEGSNDDLQLSISFTQNWPTPGKNYSSLTMNWVSWSSDSFVLDSNPSCTGHLVNLTCDLRPAVIDYPVAMQNSSFSYRKSKDKYNNYYIQLGRVNVADGYYEGYSLMTDWTQDKQIPEFQIISYIDVDEPQQPGGNTSLGGIAMALNTYYASRSTVHYDTESISNATTGQNTTTIVPVVTPTGLYAVFAQNDDFDDGCPVGYTTDYDSMLANINLLTLIISDDLLLRPDYTGGYFTYDSDPDTPAAAYYASYWDTNAQFVRTTQLKDETYFVSKFPFAWGAFASTIVVVLLILPSFWGYWELGRKVSLGPFEIANAFHAPVFNQVRSGAGHVDGVIKAVGKARVQYGVHEHEEHGVKYGFKGHGGGEVSRSG